MTGKWHIRAKADEAFEVARNIRPGMPNQHLRVTTVRYPANPTRGVHLIQSLKASGKAVGTGATSWLTTPLITWHVQKG